MRCHIQFSSHCITIYYMQYVQLANRLDLLDVCRVYSLTVIACNLLPLFKIFSNFVNFCPNFQLFCLFCTFSKKLHAYPYFLEQALVCQFLMSHCQNMKYQNYISAKVCIFTDWVITDFQTPDKTSNTIKYLPDILKIHHTSCITETFDLHQYSFCKVNSYCVNKPCTIVFYYILLKDFG